MTGRKMGRKAMVFSFNHWEKSGVIDLVDKELAGPTRRE